MSLQNIKSEKNIFLWSKYSTDQSELRLKYTAVQARAFYTDSDAEMWKTFFFAVCWNNLFRILYDRHQ